MATRSLSPLNQWMRVIMLNDQHVGLHAPALRIWQLADLIGHRIGLLNLLSRNFNGLRKA